MLLSAARIIFIVIYALEGVLIIVGNSFTIFVFWRQMPNQKRTCFILINLAVADLLVGIAEAIVLATEKIPTLKTSRRIENHSSAFQLLASGTSLFLLGLISLDRAYAVLWPVRHRVAKTRVYIYCIIGAWVAGLLVAALSTFPMYYPNVERRYVASTIHFCLFIPLLIICASYLKIRTRLNCTAAEIVPHSNRSTQHSLRLSRTVFLVIAVSLMFWLPAFLVYTFRGFWPRYFPEPAVWCVNALHLANSMVIPFVYTYRMPAFKDSLKKLCRKRRRNAEIRAVETERPAVGTEERMTFQMERAVHTLDMPQHQTGSNNNKQSAVPHESGLLLQLFIINGNERNSTPGCETFLMVRDGEC